MPRFIERIERRVPEAIKRPLRPLYGRLFWLRTRAVLEIKRVGGFEVAYRDHTADTSVIAHSFDDDIFFAGSPEYRPAENDVILDVGAHIGTFSVLAASKVPRGQVYAIEACRESYHLCRINVCLNKLANVAVFHLALADRRGECTLHYDSGNWGHSIVAPLSKRGETVRTETLAGFMDENGIGCCNFAKFNCEGAEFPILLGTPPEVLQRFRLMLILYHCDLYQRATEVELVSHLQAAGFETEIRNKSSKRGWILARMRVEASTS